jgi:hypothetical protein
MWKLASMLWRVAPRLWPLSLLLAARMGDAPPVLDARNGGAFDAH